MYDLRKGYFTLGGILSKNYIGLPVSNDFYEKNKLYRIFIHQTVLAGVILSSMDPQELQKLPFAYNYPLHLYFESPSEYQPPNLNELITLRYEAPSILGTVPIHEPLKS